MARSNNNFQFKGHVGADATPIEKNGVVIGARFPLYVDDSYKAKDANEYTERSYIFYISFFGEYLAEKVLKRAKTGAYVEVRGKTRTGKYENEKFKDASGNVFSMTTTEHLGDEFTLLREKNKADGELPAPESYQAPDDDIPF